ncbi:MAG: hypothetical protein Q7I92_12405 [Humidesulfovibrio sp.]|nr:hypothetical protein [Humidesulfovibrio sp.]
MILRDDNDVPKISMNGRQKLFILALDFVIIVELCVAMASATASPDTFTPAFMKTFFTLFIPTILAGFYGFRRLRDRTQGARG